MKTEQERTVFTNKALGVLILPLIVEQILAVSVGMVDTMMISYAGEAAISGVSLVDMINNLLIFVFAAIATGGAVIISQYIGHKDLKLACATADQLLMITALISTCIMGIILLAREPLLRILFGSITPDVMESALIYLVISAISYPFIAVFNSCSAIFRSMGNSKVSMYISVLMNLMNAVGNAILIFGFHMGVAGAALATLAARVTAACVMLCLAKNRNNLVYVKIKGIFAWKKDLIHKILYIAIPNGVENGIFQLGRVLVVSIIALFGTAQIAANAVANSLDSMGCIAGQAMNLAMITVVGQCIGAGDKEAAVFYAKKLWKITYVLTIAINLIILGCLPWILNIYTLSEEARNLSYLLVMIHNGIAMLLWPTSFTLPNALRAGGDVKFTMYVAVFSMITFRLGFSYIIGILLGLGALGVWIAMIIDWIFRASFFLWRFYQGKWKELKVI